MNNFYSITRAYKSSELEDRKKELCDFLFNNEVLKNRIMSSDVTFVSIVSIDKIDRKSKMFQCEGIKKSTCAFGPYEGQSIAADMIKDSMYDHFASIKEAKESLENDKKNNRD